MQKQPMKKDVTSKSFSSNEKVSTVGDWQEILAKTRKIKLPSGIIVEIRKLDLLDLVISKYIPLSLLSNMIKVSDGFKKGKFETGQDDLVSMVDMLRRAAVRAVVNPSLSMDGAENTMDVMQISTSDLLFIFQHSIDTAEIGSDFAPFL